MWPWGPVGSNGRYRRVAEEGQGYSCWHHGDDYCLLRINMIFSTGHWPSGLSVRQWPGDQGSIPARVIPKTQKMVLDASLLNTQHYKVRIKGKVEQSREGVAPSPTPWCCSYRKGNLRVTLDYGRQLYFNMIFSYVKPHDSYVQNMFIIKQKITWKSKVLYELLVLNMNTWNHTT